MAKEQKPAVDILSAGNQSNEPKFTNVPEKPVRTLENEPVKSAKPTLEQQKSQKAAEAKSTQQPAAKAASKALAAPESSAQEDEDQWKDAPNQTSSANPTGQRSAEDKKRHSQKKK